MGDLINFSDKQRERRAKDITTALDRWIAAADGDAQLKAMTAFALAVFSGWPIEFIPEKPESEDAKPCDTE